MLLLPCAGGAQPAPDDQQLYAKAVATMREVAEPPYLTFTTHVATSGLDRIEVRDIDGAGVARVYGRGGRAERSASWETSYRARDVVASIAVGDGRHLVTRSGIFIPTWAGVNEWLRFGMDGRAVPFAASAQPSPAPADDNLRTIGFVKAIAPSAYRIASGDAASCPDGVPARKLRLEARDRDTRAHPLSEVTIDAASARICAMRFILPIRGGHGVSRLRFGTVDGFWMTTGDDAEIWSTGLLAMHAELHFTYENVRVRDSLDDALFVREKR